MSSKILKVGVVGVGGAGVWGHLAIYQKLPNVEVVAVCDKRKERVDQIAQEYKVPHAFTDYNKMLDKVELDAISIGTGNALHAPVGIAAAKRGVHVLTEKPMAMNAREAKAMVDAAKAHRTFMMCGFNQRFRPEVRFVREVVDRGDLGQIYYVKTSWLRRLGFPGGWFCRKKEAGGGPLIDLGVHVIDVAHFMMGQPKPVAVFGATWDFIAKGKTALARHFNKTHYAGLDVEDIAVAMIRFANGAVMHVEASWAGYATDGDVIKQQIIGTEGSAILEGNPPVKIWREVDGQPYTMIPSGLPRDDQGVEKVRHFVDCIRRKVKPIIRNEDGLVIQKILDGIYESARRKKEVTLR